MSQLAYRSGPLDDISALVAVFKEIFQATPLAIAIAAFRKAR